MRHIVPIALAVLLLTTGCERRAEYPFAEVAAITSQFDATEWQHAETLGSTAGPFKALEDQGLNAGARKSVWYTLGGSRVEKNLDLHEEVLLRRFENPQGDSLVIVYKRRPQPPGTLL